MNIAINRGFKKLTTDSFKPNQPGLTKPSLLGSFRFNAQKFISNLSNRLKSPLLIIVLLASWSEMVNSDIIYFTDGMKTICQEKAWEENGEIKCEYEGVILSYKKADVLRIEKRRSEKQSEEYSNPEPSTSDAGKTVTGSNTVAKSEGMAFYDPRRTYKYWTSETSKHHTLKEALETLAQQYDRSPEWIQTHMGETNDLNEIHQNLTTNKLNPDPVASVNVKPVKTDGIKFYDPRRTYKYWTSETSKHQTLKEALETLAQQYDRSPEWIQTHMGETNDLNEIHQNLKNKKFIESTTQ